jgi:hypothetical protein
MQRIGREDLARLGLAAGGQHFRAPQFDVDAVDAGMGAGKGLKARILRSSSVADRLKSSAASSLLILAA